MSTSSNISYTFFDELYRKNYSSLVSFVSSYVYDREKAEDIAQKAFMIIWERREILDCDNSVKSYLYSTAKNLTLDYLKHKKVRDLYVNTQTNLISELDQDLNIEALTILRDEEIEKKLKMSKIKKLIFDLPLSDRKIFILSKFNNLTYTEVADILGISTKTVEKRISLTIKFLKKRLTIYIILL